MPEPTVKATATVIVDKVLTNMVKDPDVNLSKSGKEDIKAAVVKETTAVIMNQTNQEPWYQSRIIVGQYATLIVTVLGLLGYAIEPEFKEEIIGAVISVGALVNPLWTLYARIFAKKPMTILGTGSGQ